MNFFNVLILLSKIGGKIGNVDTGFKFGFDIKHFRQLNNLSFLKHIPEFDKDRNFILVNHTKQPIGTILRRPLDIIPALSSLNIEYHYESFPKNSSD
jgi:hypothetical protein